MSKEFREDKPSGATVTGYFAIYEQLIEDLTNFGIWSILIAFLLANAFIGLTLFLTVATARADSIVDLSSLFSNLVFLAFSVGAYSILFGLFIGLAVGLRDQRSKIGQITVRLLVSIQRPYSGSVGLCKEELERLLEIAKIEQSAADWRGNILSLAVWGTILGVVSWADNYLPPDLSLSLTDIRSGSPVITMTWAALWGTLVFFALRLAYRLNEHIGRFLGREAANRSIQLASQEALAIIADLGLSKEQSFSSDQKKRTADLMDATIVPYEQQKLWRAKEQYCFDHGQEHWLLLFRAEQILSGKKAARLGQIKPLWVRSIHKRVKKSLVSIKAEIRRNQDD